MGRVGLRPKDESVCGHTHIMKAGIAMGVSSEGGLTEEKILKMDSGKGCVWSRPMMMGGWLVKDQIQLGVWEEQWTAGFVCVC